MITDEQVAQLLRPINPKRVNKDAKGFSHLEAYDVRAHLIRCFGFGGWSQRVLAMELIYETHAENDKKQPVVSVAYRAHVDLEIVDLYVHYSEWAMGSAKNFPARQLDEAHDFAMKTAESQALKRAAVNLGDQFGLSLYNKGSVNALVGRTLADGVERADQSDVDEHVVEVAPEDTPADEPRTTNGTAPPAVNQALADSIRDRLEEGPLDIDPKQWLSGLTREMAQGGVIAARVTDHAGNDVALKLLLEDAAKMIGAGV